MLCTCVCTVSQLRGPLNELSGTGEAHPVPASKGVGQGALKSGCVGSPP